MRVTQPINKIYKLISFLNNVNSSAVRLATCGLGICSRRRKQSHVCFLAVSAGVLKVRLDMRAPKKFSYILQFSLTFTILLHLYLE